MRSIPTALKHRWSIGNNYLAGITLDRWFDLLRAHPVSPAYWHRAAFITAASALNSISACRERRFDAAVNATEIEHPPVFILGHWRSGTTHLHNLLAHDPRFAFANTYQVTNPLTFLSSEETNTRRFTKLVPDKRPMDGMAMGFALPQEDEFAPCLSALKSPYLGISFPRNTTHFDRYLTFEGVPRSEIEEWKSAFLHFCRKLTYKYRLPLLLKSPTHTARIGLLLELFPDARFIHIHRHPHDVFRSTRHYWDTAVWYTYLQKPDRDGLDEEILHRYRTLHDAFHAQRPLIPVGRFHELSFQELESDPLDSLACIYQCLGLPGFETARPSIQAYLESLTDYQKNRFPPLDPATAEHVTRACQTEFALWNYDSSNSGSH